MAGNIGVRLRIDASDSKSQIDALGGSVKKLNENIRDANSSARLPRFMGGGEGSLRPGELAATPDRTAAQMIPHTVPAITGQPMYGANSYNGQMSPGGILADGRRMPNTQFNIEQVKDQIEGLGDVIEGLTRDLQEAWKTGDVKSIANISTALENAKSTELSMRNQVKGYEREEKDRSDKSDPMKQFGGYLAAHLATQLAQSFVSAGNTIVGSQKSFASGDYTGALVQKEKGLGQLIGGGIGTLLGGLVGSFIAPGAGTVAGAGIGGSLGNFLGGLGGDFTERDLAYSGQYKNALPEMESFYQRFGGNIAGMSGAENSQAALNWYNRASDMSYGTGRTTEELMQAAQSRAAYGNYSGEHALSMGRQDLMWQRFSGADLGNIQRLGGTALRYGGDADAVQKAFAGLQASGMGKGQFDEFLTSMQRIMEDGIEKGFVRGADEIAGNMTMLSKLSGGSALWMGEQGAQRLGQMNNSIAKATDLKSIEDVTVFSVASDLMRSKGIKDDAGMDAFLGKDAVYTGTYVDSMQLMEQGLKNPTMLRNLMQSVQGLEGMENTAGQIERYKNMFDLNYAGAAQVWEMSQNSGFMEDPESFTAKVDEIRTNVDYKSDSQKLQDALTKLSTEGINVGSITFDKVEMPYLAEAVEQMKLIHLDLSKKVDGEEYAAENFERVETVAQTVATRIVEENPGGAGAYHMLTIGDIEKHAEGRTTFHKDDENGIALSREFLDTYQGITPAMTNDKSVMDAVQSAVDEFYKAGAWYSKEGAGISADEESKIKTTLDALTAAINAFNNKPATRVNVIPR